MPVYVFGCPQEHEYEKFLHLADYNKTTKCPQCGKKGKRLIKPRASEPSFSDKVFPYYDTSLNKIFQDKGHKDKWMNKHGYIHTGGDHMTWKQERKVLQMRQWGSNARHARQD